MGRYIVGTLPSLGLQFCCSKPKSQDKCGTQDAHTEILGNRCHLFHLMVLSSNVAMLVDCNLHEGKARRHYCHLRLSLGAHRHLSLAGHRHPSFGVHCYPSLGVHRHPSLRLHGCLFYVS